MTAQSRRADAIVAYTFRADVYCPGCILFQVTDDEFLTTSHTELVLNFVAEQVGVDRTDEHTFDSDDFPKVVFSDQVEEPEFCGECGGEIS